MVAGSNTLSTHFWVHDKDELSGWEFLFLTTNLVAVPKAERSKAQLQKQFASEPPRVRIPETDKSFKVKNNGVWIEQNVEAQRRGLDKKR